MHILIFQYGVRYEWDSKIQGLMLGAYFWGYISTSIPGGLIAEKVGASRIVAITGFLSAILTILTPLAASIHYGAVIFVRILLGFLGVSSRLLQIMYNVIQRASVTETIINNRIENCHSVLIDPQWLSTFIYFYLGSSLSSSPWFDLAVVTPRGKGKICRSSVRGNSGNCRNLARVGCHYRNLGLAMGFLCPRWNYCDMVDCVDDAG